MSLYLSVYPSCTYKQLNGYLECRYKVIKNKFSYKISFRISYKIDIEKMNKTSWSGRVSMIREGWDFITRSWAVLTGFPHKKRMGDSRDKKVAVLMR